MTRLAAVLGAALAWPAIRVLKAYLFGVPR
jgi:hypothetical protein